MNSYTGTSGNDSITPDGLSAGVKADPAGTVPSTGIDTIYGEAGNDDLNGGGGADKIYGGDGKDAIAAQGMDWLIHAGDGDDRIEVAGQANSATDPIQVTVSGNAYGDAGNDLLAVNFAHFWDFKPDVTGTVLLHGGIGNDTIGAALAGPAEGTNLERYSLYAYGDAGNDQLTATSQMTFSVAYPFFPGNNNDYLFGGTGNDSYLVFEQRDVVVEMPNEGRDGIEAWGTDYMLPANVEDLRVHYLPFYDLMYRYTGNELDNVITDGNQNDTIFGGGGSDTIRGGPGDDTIYGAMGSANNTGDGADKLYGDDGDDTLWGQAGGDLMQGGDGNDTMHGGAGNELMSGGLGEDRVYGDAGDDVVSGNGGRDWLAGGAGNDRFDYDNVTQSAPGAANRDVIFDFAGAGKTGGDVIDLSSVDANSGLGGNQAFTFGGTGAGHVWAVASGADSLIQADTGGATGPDFEILVKDVAAASWTAGDFIL